MNPKLLRQIAWIVNLTLIGIVIWQTAAFADNQCPNNITCPNPPGCTVSMGPYVNCCTTLNADCCQFHCQRWSYVGTGCPGDCITRTLDLKYSMSTCQTGANDGLCSQ